MLSQFISLFTKPANLTKTATLFFVFFLGLRIFPLYNILRDFYRIPGVSFSRRLEVFYEYIFLGFFDLIWYEQVFVLALSLATAINVFLFILYFKRQRKIFGGRGFFAAMSGIFLGIFGVGCLSCGVIALAPILTLLGLGGYIGFFQNHAFGISLLGLFFVLISILYLLKKLGEPLVCKAT